MTAGLSTERGLGSGAAADSSAKRERDPDTSCNAEGAPSLDKKDDMA